MSNSDNPRIGAEFQKQVRDWFEDEYNDQFDLEIVIPIGSHLIDPKDYKDHKFDIVCESKKIVVECKRYTWTKTGNVPSAKMGFTNEAAFYLSLLPRNYKKYIVMLKDYNLRREETLAEYYFRTNKHLLGDIVLAEYDPVSKDMKLYQNSSVV